jgi:hypothetical protein
LPAGEAKPFTRHHPRFLLEVEIDRYAGIIDALVIGIRGSLSVRHGPKPWPGLMLVLRGGSSAGLLRSGCAPS